MAETLPKPAFVLVSGDFLAHGFRREFNAAAGDHSDAAYRVFVRKTMQFLGQQLEQTFPATVILPALGNNDEECGDYELQPGGPFLIDTLPILRRLVGSAGGPGFDRDWQSYGNYSARVSGIRILSTNTNFLSVHYRNACGSAADGDPGRATLAWLEAELAAAKEAQERVWLLYHILPGIDGYATLRQGSCPGTMIPMWDQAYAGAFFPLLRRYADSVVASFAGHTHMDDFRLIADAEGRYGFAVITPAVSPIFGQNPAFRTVTFDAAGGILDQTTYDLMNLPQATTAAGGVPAEWRAEYTFIRLWSLPRVDLPSLDHLYSLITDVPAEGEQWHRIFRYRARFIGLHSPVEMSNWRRRSGRSVAHRETSPRRITSNATVAAETSGIAASGSVVPRPMVRSLRRRENTCDQHRHDAGEKDPVEGSGTADRSDRRPQPLYLVQVEKIGSD